MYVFRPRICHVLTGITADLPGHLRAIVRGLHVPLIYDRVD